MFGLFNNPQISIIFVNYNVFDDICTSINSINEYSDGIDYEIIVVDNNSPDRSIDKIKEIHPQVIYLPLEKNYGFSYANNRAMEIAKGEYFLLVNPDIIFEKDSIKNLLEGISSDTSIGVIGPIQKKPGEDIERYYSFFPTLYSRLMQESGLYMTAPNMKHRFTEFWDNNIKAGKPFEVDWVIGSCMLIPKNVFEKTGGFDEAFFLFEEEVEWEYRISKLGLKRVILPFATVIHNHHSSIGKLGENYRRYHEFRSRIIYSNKHDKFPRDVARFILITLGLIFRLLRGLLIPSYRVMNNLKIHFKLYAGLLKLNFKSKSSILQNRFDPELLV